MRNTTLTSSWSISTRLTKVRIRSRCLSQSTSDMRAWTRLAKSSSRPMTSDSVDCSAASSRMALSCASHPPIRCRKPAIDQPAHAPAQLGQLRLGRGQVRAIRSAPPRIVEAPFILRGDPGRVVQQPLDLAPNRLVQPVGADLGVRAQALAAEAVGPWRRSQPACRARYASCGDTYPGSWTNGSGPPVRSASSKAAKSVADRQVVHDQDVAACQTGNNLLLDVGDEQLAVDRPVEHVGCHHAAFVHGSR